MICYVAKYIGDDVNAFDVHTRHGRMSMALLCNLKWYAMSTQAANEITLNIKQNPNGCELTKARSNL